MYRTILKDGTDEVIIKKSRFIGYAKPVESEEAAIEFIDGIKSKHYDATHNCSAYIIGEKMLIQRYSDDGEPSGTAGIPILEVLKKEELTNVAVVVTRYFGGTLLGAGGLIRAYSKGAKIAINSGKIVTMMEHDILRISYDYTYQGKILNVLGNLGIEIRDTDYDEKVNSELVVISNKTQEVKDYLIEMTGATISISKIESVLLPIEAENVIDDE